MEMKPLTLFMTAFIVIIVGLVVIQSSAQNIEQIDIASTAASSDIVHTSLTSSLSPIGEGITSSEVKAYNQTWLDFDGVSNTLDFSNDLFDFEHNDSYTLCFWFNANNITKKEPFISKGIGNYIYHESNWVTWQYHNYSGGTQYITLYKNFQNNKWYHICASSDGSIRKLYFNGLENATQDITLTGSIRSSTPAHIAKQGAIYFNGSIDRFYLYNRTLNDTEIYNIYKIDGLKTNYSIDYQLLSNTYEEILVVNSTLIYGQTGYGLYRSENGGETFSSSILSYVDSPFIFRKSDGTLLTINASMRDIFVSIGNDTNWTKIENAVNCKGALSELSITESKDGGILLGSYNDSCPYIEKSMDSGLTWSLVYNGTDNLEPSRHIHFVQTDPYTGYIYSSEGDHVAPWAVSRIIRSIDNGTTWTTILNTSDAMGQPTRIIFTPEYRIFGQDCPTCNGIMITSDDENFNYVLNLSEGPMNGFAWSSSINNITGNMYMGFVTSNANNKTSTLFYSNDVLNWYALDQSSNNSAYDGFDYISNFDELGYAYYSNNLPTRRVYKFLDNIITNNNLENILYYYNLNENNGTTTHDSSGNSNDGTITGATWTTDGILKTLTAITDYTIDTTTGLFTIVNTDYLYSWLETDYNYNLRTNTTNIAIARLIIIFLALSILAFILIIVNYYTKDFR